MDAQSHFQVAYDQPTQRLHPVADSSWHTNGTPGAPSLSSTVQSSQLFRNSDLEYTSPEGTSASPSYMQQLPENYPGQTSPSLGVDVSLPSSAMSTHMQQIESSIGPDRVLTRSSKRRAAAAAAALAGGPNSRRYSGLPFQRTPQDHSPRLYFNTPMMGSRPETPINSSEARHYAAEREHLSLQISNSLGTASGPMRSQYPLTPASSSTSASSSGAYPRYGPIYGHHSRSNSSTYSSTASTHPRSASPALSTASSVPTSVSSASPPNSAANGFCAPPQQLPSDDVFHQPTGRPKQRKQRLFNVDRKAICIYQRDNPNARQEDIAVRYGVERSTISKILKNKQKWLNVPEQEHVRIAKHRPSKFPEIEAQLVKWLEECKRDGIGLTDALIRAKAKETARTLGISEDKFKASSGWVENFKHRHGIRGGHWHADGKLAAAARAIEGRLTPTGVDGYDESPGHSHEASHGHYDCHSPSAQGYGHNAMPPPSEPGHGRLAGGQVQFHEADMHHHVSAESMSLQPAWQTASGEQQPSGAQAIAAPLILSHDDMRPAHSAHVSNVQPTYEEGPDPTAGLEPVPPPGPGVSYIVYQEVPTVPDTSEPTTRNVESALDLLVRFCVTHDPDRQIIPSSEYDTIRKARQRLFCHENGIPFDEDGWQPAP